MTILERIANRVGLYTATQLKKQVKLTREASAGWQAAAINRLTAYWTSQTLSVDSTLRKDLQTILARSRNICENSDYAKGFLNIVKSNVIGECGIQLKNKARELPRRDETTGKLDTFANRLIEEGWWEWNQRGNCTVDRSMSGTDRQNLSIETAGRDGEVLIRKVRGFDNDAQFAIQVLECDWLDFDYNDRLTNGNEIRMGIEFNRWKEPIAYYFLKRNPHDNYFGAQTEFERHERVDAGEIIHGFIKFRPEQARGIPWLATSMYRMSIVQKYEESEAIASRLNASKMGFLTTTGANVQYEGKEDGLGNKIMDSEPGAFEELPAGMDVKTVDWQHPNSSYMTFMKTALRGVATGLGVSYNTFANDMESVNFASGKLGIEAERELFKAIQNWYICSIENEIFKEWLTVQLLTQNIPLPFSKFKKFNSPDWRPRRWSYINPQQEIDAKIRAINAGLTSRQRVIAEWGGDRDEVDAEIADDKNHAESLDLHFAEIVSEPPEEPSLGTPQNAS